MLRTLFVGLTFSLLLSSNASACDDKACETAYLASVQQYVDNYQRRAASERAERQAYSKQRERKAYALYVHLHLMLFGDNPSKSI